MNERQSRVNRVLLVALACLSLTGPAWAQGFVESVEPPVLHRGGTTRITLHGRDFAPGQDLWHSLPAGSLTAKALESSPDRLIFEVTVAATAPIGICGIRAATRDGLSNVVLILVDDLPVQPGVRDQRPLRVKPPVTLYGSLREAAVDRYQLTVAAGERIGFEAVANRFGKDSDPLLTIRDASGNWVADYDNSPGLYFDFRCEHQFQQAGTYTLEFHDLRYRGSEHHRYALRIGRFPAGRVAVPAAVTAGPNLLRLPEVPGSEFSISCQLSSYAEARFVELKRSGDHGSCWVPVTSTRYPVAVCRQPDQTTLAGFVQATSPPAWFAGWLSPLRTNPFATLDAGLRSGRVQATAVTVPATLCGSVSQPGGGRSAFVFPLEKGQRIFVRGEARSLNSPLDLDLALTSATGRELRRSTATTAEPEFDFTAPVAGEYGLVVRDEINDGGPAFAYRLDVRDQPFPPILHAEVEGLTVPQGNYQCLPIVVNRKGISGPIRLKLIGAPPGMRLLPAVLADGASSIDCRLEAESSTPLGVYTLQIVAEYGLVEHPQHTLVRTQPLIDRRLRNVDLIPYALREDQTRLPPSLTDRLAVQVTPPSPYSFELTEKLLILPRYQTVAVPIITTRIPGFSGQIHFTASGGQLAEKEEGRTRVYAEFPPATVERPEIAGVVVSKILSNLAKYRVDVTATSEHHGRRIRLNRCFDLDLRPAFQIRAEPPQLSLLPGETGTVRLIVDRVPSFQGTIHLQFPQEVPGITPLPETVAIPADRNDIPLTLTADVDALPRQQRLTVVATGLVSGYEESLTLNPLQIEILRRPPSSKPSQ